METPAITRSSHVALHLPLQSLLLLLALLVIILGTLSGPSVADERLYSDHSLTTGQSLSVSSYLLIMQSDCNLVLYDGGTAVWASGSQGQGSNCHVIMQRDGNLVVYSGSGSVVWASNTVRAIDRYTLVLQRDRNLLIYGPAGAIWATGTMVAGVKASISVVLFVLSI